jgi:hypothetical protein
MCEREVRGLSVIERLGDYEGSGSSAAIAAPSNISINPTYAASLFLQKTQKSRHFIWPVS